MHGAPVSLFALLLEKLVLWLHPALHRASFCRLLQLTAEQGSCSVNHAGPDVKRQQHAARLASRCTTIYI